MGANARRRARVFVAVKLLKHVPTPDTMAVLLVCWRGINLYEGKANRIQYSRGAHSCLEGCPEFVLTLQSGTCFRTRVNRSAIASSSTLEMTPSLPPALSPEQALRLGIFPMKSVTQPTPCTPHRRLASLLRAYSTSTRTSPPHKPTPTRNLLVVSSSAQRRISMAWCAFFAQRIAGSMIHTGEQSTRVDRPAHLLTIGGWTHTAEHGGPPRPNSIRGGAAHVYLYIQTQPRPYQAQ